MKKKHPLTRYLLDSYLVFYFVLFSQILPQGFLLHGLRQKQQLMHHELRTLVDELSQNNYTLTIKSSAHHLDPLFYLRIHL